MSAACERIEEASVPSGKAGRRIWEISCVCDFGPGKGRKGVRMEVPAIDGEEALLRAEDRIRRENENGRTWTYDTPDSIVVYRPGGKIVKIFSQLAVEGKNSGGAAS